MSLVMLLPLNGEKLAVMVFKSTVYEHRRKPKGLFRPKQRATLKDLQQVSFTFSKNYFTISLINVLII